MTEKPKTPAKTPQKAAEPALVVEVIGPLKGFRRAGHRFGPEATVIPVADLSEDALAEIEAEPALVSTRREVPGDT